MKQPWRAFGALLREHRLGTGLTQRELAARAGVSVRTVRDIEQGRVERPRARSARRLAAALGAAGDDNELLAAVEAAAGEVRVRVDVLGTLTVHRDDVPLDLRSAKLRCLLGLLAVRHGQPVSPDEIVEVLWDSRPPKTSYALVHTYIRHLRTLLEPGRRRGSAAQSVESAAGGYRLRLDGTRLDLARFDELTGAAASAADPKTALRLYGEALALWRAPILADLDPRLRQHPGAVAASARRLAAALAYADLAASLDHDADAVTVLRGPAADEPLHEGLQARVILSLARSGRQAESLALFAKVRTRLAEELGVEPGPELRRAHVRVLRQELTATGGSDSMAGRFASAPGVIPAQLPAEAVAFTGRERDVHRLDALLTGEAPDPVPAAIVAIVGTAGVGKTALAVHWAGRVRDRFPDGQLYVDLRGYAPGAPLRPIEALGRFLRTLDVPAERIPAEVDEASALFRTLLADRRILVVLDNARDAEQVRPLLPGGSGCLALVTSRDRLSALVARDGARRVSLDVLTPAEALTLLTRLLGLGRLAAEPDAGRQLAQACGYLPLAVRIAAAKLTNHPYDSIARYADDLRGGRLAALAVDEDSSGAVFAAFDLSYSALPPQARLLFRRIGLIPGVDLTAEVAGALLDIGAEPAARLLDRLCAAHLLDEHAPRRYGCHDLLRLYARDRCRADDADAVRQAASDRLFEYYLHTADAAARQLYPDILRLPGEPAPVAAFADHAAALAWLDEERHNLVAAVRYAADRGPRPAAWLLSDTLRGYFWARMYTVDWQAVAGAALAAAEGVPRAQAAARLSLGDLAMRLGRYRSATEHYGRALDLIRSAGWDKGEVAVLCNLGVVFWQMGRLQPAADQFTLAHEINLRTGQLQGQAATLGNLGLVYREMGRLDQAEQHYTRALEVDRRVGSRMGEAIDLANVGEVYHMLGDLGTALAHLSRALDLHREVGDRDTEADTLQRMAAVHRDAGRYPDALSLAAAALELATEIGNRRVAADAANTLGSVHLDAGNEPAAAQQHERALRLSSETGNRHPELQALVGLAACQQYRGDLAAAVPPARHALRVARRAGYLIVQGQALLRLASVRLGQRELARAIGGARRAVEVSRGAGHRLGQAHALLVLAAALEGTGETASARVCRQDADQLFADVGALRPAGATCGLA